MGRWLAALLLLAASAPPAHAADATPAIDDCLAKLDAAADVGYARISARCPELPAALAQKPAADWLPADWNRPDNQLSAQGLTELRALLAREQAVPARARALPDVAKVPAVLAAVTRSEAAQAGWWTRFKEWLRRILTPQVQRNESWVTRWLDGASLSRRASELIAWSVLALIVALAVGIIVRELRIAGLLGGRERSRAQAGSGLPGGRRGASAGQIVRAAPRERPGLLLEAIAKRLAEQDRLPPARALTARELVGRARLPDEAGRSRLAELAAVSERVRFSGADVAAASLTAALAGGEQLLASLEAPLATARGAG